MRHTATQIVFIVYVRVARVWIARPFVRWLVRSLDCYPPLPHSLIHSFASCFWFVRRSFFDVAATICSFFLYSIVRIMYIHISFPIMLIISFPLICLFVLVFVFIFNRFGMCLVQKVRKLLAKTAAPVLVAVAAATTAAIENPTKLMK